MVINVVLLIHQPIDNNYNDTSNDNDNDSSSSIIIGLNSIKKISLYAFYHYSTSV